MKKSNLIILLFCCLASVACSDWLDVMPKTSIPEEDLFDDESGFKDALTGLYLRMGTPELYSRELTYNYMDMLAGRYEYAPNIHNWEDLYAYDGTVYRSTVNGFFTNIYNIIANINNLLRYMEENRSVIQTPHFYETMKGEALGLRAFLHFDLLRMFGPVYAEDPTGASIPYRLDFNNVASAVLPASEVVDHCLEDLQAADSLLSEHDSNIFTHDPKADPFTEMRQYRMNKWAVKALMARIYLYKGDAESKAQALKYAREVVESGNFVLCEENVSNPILFPEHIFSLYVYELDKTVDADFVNQHVSSIMSISNDRLATLYETKGLGSLDFRGGANAFSSKTDGTVTKRVLSKYLQGVYANNSDPTFIGEGAIPLIRLPEMYYIMAECEPDTQLAAEYINTVRLSRQIPASDALNGGPAFDQPAPNDSEHTLRIYELMKEYQKEFYGEGQLFYFYKRHNYRSFFLSPSNMDMRTKYRFPLPDDEIAFGNNGK